MTPRMVLGTWVTFSISRSAILVVVSWALADPIDFSVLAALTGSSASGRVPSAEIPGSFSLTQATSQKSLCMKHPATGTGGDRGGGWGLGFVSALPSLHREVCPAPSSLLSILPRDRELLAFAFNAGLGLHPLTRALVP